MLRFTNFVRVLMMLFLFSAVVIPARADGVSNPTYSVSGIAVFTGNNTCTPAPCSEAVAFSFDLGFKLGEGLNGPSYLAFATNITQIWTGDLGSFTQSFPGPDQFIFAFPDPTCSGTDINFIGFFNAGGDEADLHLCDNSEPTPVVPVLDFADLFRCATTTCSDEFPVNGGFSGPDTEGVLEDVSIKQIPEPAALPLLALGLLSLAFFWVCFRSPQRRSVLLVYCGAEGAVRSIPPIREFSVPFEGVFKKAG